MNVKLLVGIALFVIGIGMAVIGIAGVGDTAARAAFVIDKSGTIQYSERTPTPKDLPDFNKIKDTLAKLK